MGSPGARRHIIFAGEGFPVLQQVESGLTVHRPDGIRGHAFLRSNGILCQNGSSFHINLGLCPL